MKVREEEVNKFKGTLPHHRRVGHPVLATGTLQKHRRVGDAVLATGTFAHLRHVGRVGDALLATTFSKTNRPSMRAG